VVRWRLTRAVVAKGAVDDRAVVACTVPIGAVVAATTGFASALRRGWRFAGWLCGFGPRFDVVVDARRRIAVRAARGCKAKAGKHEVESVHASNTQVAARCCKNDRKVAILLRLPQLVVGLRTCT
jgi:hypothetical protein